MFRVHLAGPFSGVGKNAFLFVEALELSWKQKIVNVAAQNLLCTPAVEACGALIPETNFVLQVADDERILHQVELERSPERIVSQFEPGDVVSG